MTQAEKNDPLSEEENLNEISKLEEKLLDNAGSGLQDDENLFRSDLDDTDADGVPLNQHSDDVSGSDLDVPGSSLDDEKEAKGSEDEENNSYSLSDNE